MESKEDNINAIDLAKDLEILANNADMILDDLRDYYATIDRKMASVLKRVEGFIASIKELSQEELCLECYSCFIQVMHLSVHLDIYQKRSALLLFTGRETQNEEWIKKIHKMLHEFRNNLYEGRVSEAKEGGIKSFTEIQTAFDYGYAWAKKAEAMMKHVQDDLVNNLSEQEKTKYNYKAMATLTDCGFTPEFFDAVGISPTSSIRKSKIVFTKLDDKKAEHKLRHIHNQVLGESLMYPLLFQNILTHVEFMLGEMVWDKFSEYDYRELFLRLNVHRSLFLGQSAIKSKIKDMIATELFEEGEDVDKDKVVEVKKRFSVMCKANPIMKLYRQSELGDKLMRDIIASKPTLQDLEEFFLYYDINSELDKYYETAKDSAKPASVINIDKNFAPMIDNHDGGVVDATALVATMQKLMEQLQQQKLGTDGTKS